MIGHIRLCAASALSLALASGPAWAGAAVEEEGSLPQFDVTQFPEQIFWLLVSFTTLYVLMAFVALPRVARTQENRQRVIEHEIESARQANDKAKESVEAVERSLGDARDKAQADMNEMLAKVSEEENEKRAARERELLRNVRRAEGDIVRTRTKALTQLQADADALAGAIVDKILGTRTVRS